MVVPIEEWDDVECCAGIADDDLGDDRGLQAQRQEIGNRVRRRQQAACCLEVTQRLLRSIESDFGPERAENTSLQVNPLAAGTVTGRVNGPFTPVPTIDCSSRAVARVR
jgi:hypothetical protein